MSTIDLNYHRLLHIALSVLTGLLVLAALHRPAWATGHTFVLPAMSGYGVSDCLGKADGCGEVVASAWCEAHGYSAPLAYGKAEDVTGTSPGAKPVKLAPDDFIATCGD